MRAHEQTLFSCLEQCWIETPRLLSLSKRISTAILFSIQKGLHVAKELSALRASDSMIKQKQPWEIAAKMPFRMAINSAIWGEELPVNIRPSAKMTCPLLSLPTMPMPKWGRFSPTAASTFTLNFPTWGARGCSRLLSWTVTERIVRYVYENLLCSISSINEFFWCLN